MRRLEERIRRSKRNGKLVLAGVLLISLLFGLVLVQALTLADARGRTDLVWTALLGLVVVVVVDLFSLFLIRRQHRLLDEARDDFREMIRGAGHE